MSDTTLLVNEEGAPRRKGLLKRFKSFFNAEDDDTQSEEDVEAVPFSQLPVGNDAFLWRVWSLAGMYGVGFVVAFTVEYIQNYLLTLASERIAQRCRSAFIGAVLERNSLDCSLSTGELSNQLSNHIDRLKEGLGDRIGLFVKCLSTFASCCTLSFIIDWRTALCLCWCGPIYIISNTLLPKLSKKATKRTLKILEEANGISEESILNVKTVASCNGQTQMIEKYSSTLASGVGAAVRAAATSGLLDGITDLLYFSFNTLGLWYATISYHSGRVRAAGDVFAVVFMALSGSKHFARLGPHVIALMKARIAAAKVYETIDSAKNSDEDERCVAPLLDPTRTDLRIEFKNVSYSFPSRAQPVLQSLSFDLEPGQSLGLVGKSGCGKSTTLKLLTRFLETNCGQILLDGIPLENYDKKKWRQMIGVVSQEPCLFTGTIRENILLGRPFTEAEVENACRIAYAHDFIRALDKGYETLLGPSGVSLSGGQKQRIGIARAIVSNPRLLLLDEATSALDTKSERIVQEALDNASQGRSTMVIAHRLSTIKNVDQVIVMADGEVVERGGYDELRTEPHGIFSKMIRDQEIERRRSKSRDAKEEEEEESEEESMETVDVDSTKDGMITHKVEDQAFPCMAGGFFTLLARNKGKTAIVLSLGFMRSLCSPLFSLRYFYVFGSLKDDDYEKALFWLMAGTMAVAVYNSILQIIRHPICQYIGETVMNELRAASLRSLLNRPMAYFDRVDTSPSACAVLLSQQPPIAVSLTDNKLAVVVDGLIAAFCGVALTFLVFPPNGVVALVYMLSYLLLLTVCEKFTDKAYKEVVSADKSGELAVEVFDNVATIQQLAVEDHFQSKFDEIQSRREAPLARKIRYQSIVHAINESNFFLFDCLATCIGVYFVYSGYYNTQLLFLSESVLSTVGWTTFMMSRSYKEMVTSVSAVRLIFGLIDPTSNNDIKEDECSFEGKVDADSISFSYPSQPNRKVLADVSFTVEKGRSLAFVGPSGGGKSTIVNLLERFYDPNSGQLRLDVTPFTSISPFQLRSSIALVSQEPILFRGTIAENIRLGVEEASDEDVRRACQLANATEFVEAFPEGYETLVGEKGRSLSGGQKQRIAIARALVRNPRVIILDEATSALDTHSEKVVRIALESSAQGRTSVSIAHRLDTIRNCDEIYFVEGGRIVERGSHEDLKARRGRYYAMIEQQRLS